ncbi:MAG: ATP-binding protein [Proteobacteria bacterium]|nr:ATP-binding protein [Pseudomonadota bacterium]
MAAPSVVHSALIANSDKASREAIRGLCADIGLNCECIDEPSRVVSAVAQRSYDVVIAELPTGHFAAEELVWRLRLSNPHQALIVVSPDGTNAKIPAPLLDASVGVIPRAVSREILESSIARVMEAVRGKHRTAAMYRFASAERAVFEFETGELAKIHPSLVIVERLERAGWIDEQTRKRIEVAFQEALANACDHGNLELESKWKEQLADDGLDLYSVIRNQRLADKVFSSRRVVVITDFSSDRLEIRIRDEGRGFTPKQPEATKTLPICSGRGLTLMYQTMDKVWYERGGREVVMVKIINPKHQTKEW